MTLVRRVEAWLDAALPPVCACCAMPLAGAERAGGLCSLCWTRAPSLPEPLCRRCGAPVPSPGDDVPCLECERWPAFLVSARARYAMDGTAAAVARALKYGAWRRLAEPMARRMVQARLEPRVVSELDVVIPVPLSPAKERERGFNQAALLAEAVARLRGWRAEPAALRRTRETRSQTVLHPAERAANVQGAFEATLRARALRGRHVLVVDDVLTTGATSLECARVLCRAGIRAVSVLTFARATTRLTTNDHEEG